MLRNNCSILGSYNACSRSILLSPCSSFVQHYRSVVIHAFSHTLQIQSTCSEYLRTMLKILQNNELTTRFVASLSTAYLY